MERTQQERFNQIIQQVKQQDLPLGYKCESEFTAEDRSYTLLVRFVDLQNVILGIPSLRSEYDTLMKYSKAEYSPVSSEPAEFIKLATPRYYRELKMETNSELISDDLESAYRESLDWNRRGNRWIESVKETLSNIPNSRYTKVELTLGRDNFCMYCTSIDPHLSYEREKQMKNLSTDYDFMTKIEKPSEFANQLGRDIGKHIVLHNDLELDFSQPPILHTLGSFYRRLSGVMGEYLIIVDHGPVIYFNENEIGEIVKKDSEVEKSSVLPFVKRVKYKEQREYRFIVSIQGHILDKKEFYLKVSDDLKELMSKEF